MTNILKILNKIGDLILLNFLFLVTTIATLGVGLGASLCALNACFLDLNVDDEKYYAKNYFKNFKRNFKVSTITTLFFFLIGLFVIFNYRIIDLYTTGNLKFILFSILGLFLLEFLIIFVNIFSLLAKFELTGLSLIKFTLLFGHLNILYSLFFIILYIISVSLIIYLSFAFIVIIFAVIVNIQVLIIKKLLRRYKINE